MTIPAPFSCLIDPDTFTVSISMEIACDDQDQILSRPVGEGFTFQELEGERVRFSGNNADVGAVPVDVSCDGTPFSPDDFDLNDDELASKYSTEAGGPGEHPYFLLSAWQQEVANQGSRAGYWVWLYNVIQNFDEGETVSLDCTGYCQSVELSLSAKTFAGEAISLGVFGSEQSLEAAKHAIAAPVHLLLAKA